MNRQNRSGAEIIASENRSKYIQSRISRVEYNFGLLCSTMSCYTRKTARIRDKGDKLCGVLRDYVESELLNTTTKISVQQFSEHLSTVQDYRQAQVNRLEAKILKPLCAYGSICKDAKVDIRCSLVALEKEQKLVKHLQKTTCKFPQDPSLIDRAKADVEQASVQSIRTSDDLNQKMNVFERKKLHDLKTILTDFVKIEMAFHAKALETYTKCFHSVNSIKPEADMMEFSRNFTPTMADSRAQTARRASLVSFCSSADVVTGDLSSTQTPAGLANDTLSACVSPTAPYSMVITEGIPHYKMKDDIQTDDKSQDVEDESEDESETDDDDDDDDDEEDDETLSTPTKRVTLNNFVKVVDLK